MSVMTRVIAWYQVGDNPFPGTVSTFFADAYVSVNWFRRVNRAWMQLNDTRLYTVPPSTWITKHISRRGSVTYNYIQRWWSYHIRNRVYHNCSINEKRTKLNNLLYFGYLSLHPFTWLNIVHSCILVRKVGRLFFAKFLWIHNDSNYANV